MQIFEIRIFGNVKGFSELKLGTENHLMDGSIINMIGYENIQTDAFSIAYAPEYYVLSYHFTFPHSASSTFRSQRASASIVIKRGFKLISPLQTLIKIKSSLVEYASSMKDNLPQLLASKAKDFYALVESEITTAPEQAMLNWSADGAVNKAIVAFDEENQLSKLLESPFRREFRLDSGHGVVFLIYRKQASSLWPQLRGKYKAIKIENYDALEQMELEFPDGHRVFVDSLDAEIDYTCKKEFYKPYRFLGKISDRLSDWNIRVIGNRYIIGFKLEPVAREFNVRCVDVMTNEEYHPTEIKFSVGVYDEKRKILRLIGKENVEANNIKTNKEFRVVELVMKGDVLLVKLEKLYEYSIDYIWNDLIKAGIKTPIFFIEDTNSARYHIERTDKTKYLPTPYDRAFLWIPETSEYYGVRSKFDSNGRVRLLLQKKHFTEIVFNLGPDGLANSVNKKRMKIKLVCFVTNLKSKKWESIIDTCPYTFRIADLPTGDFQYICYAKGYKGQQGVIRIEKYKDKYFVTVSMVLTFQAKLIRLLKRNIFVIFSFIVGVLFGGICTCSSSEIDELEKRNNTLLGECEQNHILIDSLQKITFDQQRRIAEYEEQEIQRNRSLSNRTQKENSMVIDQVRRPDIIAKILHLPNRDKMLIKQKGSYLNKMLLMKLSSYEQKEIERVLNHPAFYSVSIPQQVLTVREALNYLNKISAE